ncbi:unnamed protein product, partial [Symbiodinium pilosum]
MWGSSSWQGAGKGKGKQYTTGWESAWSAADKGQDKGWGSKGYAAPADKGWSKGKEGAGWQASPWTESSWAGQIHDSEKGKGKTKDYVTRLSGRYAFSKAILRPYADENGNAVYTAGPSTVAKNTFDKEQLRQGLDWRNSELVRRPAVGLTTISGSMRMLKMSLEAIPDDIRGTPAADAIRQLGKLLEDAKGRDFLTACEVLTKERTGNVPADKLATAVDMWLKWFRENKAFLATSLPEIVIFASSLYLGSMQALEAEWQRTPKDLTKLNAFILAAMEQRRTESAAWHRQSGLGGDSDEEGNMAARGGPGVNKSEAAKKHKKREKTDSSSSSSESSRKKRKREKKAKKEKKSKKARKEEKKAKDDEKDPGIMGNLND